jgi:integrase
MARGIQKLSALQVERTKKPGYYADGGGLYLQVTASGSKSWLFRFMLCGRAREMGLGPLHTVSLAEARLKASDCRRQLLEGIDPIEARKAARNAAQLTAAKSITFDKCAEAYIGAHRAGWKNAKHADQWENTIAAYASPVFGSFSVASIDTTLVMKCLEAIWATKAETASRLRGRIENILDWATVRGYRQGENPARWKGHLDKLLPARSKVAKVTHHPALPYSEIGDFIAALRSQEGVSARGLEFAILTATRTSETINATWNEFDLDAGIWTIPPERMKAGKEHRVPLSTRALEIIKALQETKQGDYVFPGARINKPLSNMAFLMTLRRMERSDLTAHGFRSTFRDWAAEMTAYPHEVAEMALAHAVGDKVEAAYRRGDLFEKRRRMMEDWASYCCTPKNVSETVVPIRKAMIG